MPDLLDTQIRDLVARAVDDAPPAPDLDAVPMAATVTSLDTRRRWPSYAATAGVAAAVTAGLIVVTTRDTDAPIDPTTVTTAAPPVVTSTAAPLPTTPSTTPESSPVATTSVAPTTAPGSPAVAPTTWLAIAGPDAVTRTDSDGRVDTVTTEPMSVAIAAPNGEVFTQRLEWSENPTDNPILRWSATTGTLIPIDLPEVLTTKPLILRDVVGEVDGPAVLVIEASAGNCPNPETCDNLLYTLQVDSGEAAEVGIAGQWEYSIINLSYGNNGLAVGDGTYVGSDVYSISASPDVVPVGRSEFGTVGCDDGFENCSRMLTVETSGTYVAWIDNVESNAEAVIQPTDGRGSPVGQPTRVPIAELISGDPQADTSWFFRGMNIAGIEVDPSSGQVVGGRLAMWWSSPSDIPGVTDQSAVSGVIIDLATRTSQPVTGTPSLT